MRVYVVEGDNNEEYEDNFTWVEGVFSTRAAAATYLADTRGARRMTGSTVARAVNVMADGMRERVTVEPWAYPDTDDVHPPACFTITERELRG